ncbi:MAG: Mut7-C RNAse domain-containing protein [Bacteroidota bacterium]
MQSIISIRFYAGLNFFVPKKLKQKTFQYPVKGQPSVKDLIESLSVPHTEIDLILVNSHSVDFSYKVKSLDQISVYPFFYKHELRPDDSIKRIAFPEKMFIADAHLGKLAALLRMFGFDTVYRNDIDDDEIIERGVAEKRIILTRDLGILKHAIVEWGYFPRSQDSKIQLKEVIDRFDLKKHFKPFSLCIKCNGKLRAVEKGEIIDKLEDNTKSFYKDFYRCKNCDKVYWQGSHYHKMIKFVEEYKFQ